MFRFVILSALIVSAFGVPVPDGLVPLDEDRIVGGAAATSIEQFPYMVSIKQLGNHRCGGCLYLPTVIISAAHCFQGIPANSLTVVAGTLSRTSGGISKAVSRLINHENYSDATDNNDISILFLVSGFTYSNTIRAISLAPAGSIPVVNSLATVTGWGTLTENGATPITLQFVRLPIVSNTDCARSHPSSTITNAMICAGELQGGKDACQGDSGGPFVFNNILIGVVSWGEGCARPGLYAVFSSIGNLRTWIDSKI